MNNSDLHAHLGSMVSPRKLWELAHEQGIKLDTSNYNTFINRINGVNDRGMNHGKYLDKFNLTQKIQSSPLAIEQSVYNAIAEAYIQDDVDLIEIRFNPMLRNNHGYFDLDMIISHACIGLQKACNIYPVRAGLIISTDRSFSKRKHRILAEKAVKFSNMGVVGFDMSGASHSRFKIERLKESFKIAFDGGIKRTIHVGELEETGIREIKYAAKELNVNRIGHGILAVNDPYVLRQLSVRDVVLELCPTSNVTTQCVKSYPDFTHIIDELKKAEVKFTINTDGMVFLNTTISKEFEHLVRNDCIEESEIKKIKMCSRRSTFIK